MTRTARILFAISIAASFVGTEPAPAVLEPAEAEASEKLEGAELVKALQRGGFVIYFRHTATQRDQQDADQLDLDNCATQRRLSEEGRRQAREIGAAFTALRIRVAKVLTSPLCRAVETAQLAFGRYEKTPGLTYSLRLPGEQRKQVSAQLREWLAIAPASGASTVLISHNANLKEAVALWPKGEGDAHVFRPGGRDAFTHVGEVLVSQWPEWARAMGQAQ